LGAVPRSLFSFRATALSRFCGPWNFVFAPTPVIFFLYLGTQAEQRWFKKDDAFTLRGFN